MRKIVFLILLIIVLQINLTSKGTVSTDPLVNSINELRLDNRLPPYLVNENLLYGAKQRAKDLFESGQRSHDGYVNLIVDSDYTTKLEIYLNLSSVGENLSKDYNDNQVLAAWIHSPEHKDNLLDDFSEVGIGRYGNIIVLWLGKKFIP